MNDQTALVPLADTMQLGKVLAESGFFQDSKSSAQAVVKVLAGRELGIGAVASMTGINIIQGRVALSANLIAALVKRSGRYSYHVTKLDDDTCIIRFLESGKFIGESVFTKSDAVKAGTRNMDKFPRNMLFARAMSNGAKWYCADIFGGPVYTPEELGASVNEDGDVIDSTVRIIRTDSAPAGNGRTAEPPPDDGWNDLPSASEERRAKPAAQPQAPAQPIGNPKCPQCGGPMWDNREKVIQAVRDGRKPGPEWACKAGKWNPDTRATEGCDGKLWAGEWPPRQHPSEEQVNGLLKLVKEVYPTPGDKAAFRDWIAQMFGVNVETASSVRELLNKLTPAQAETAANELDATLRQMTAQA